MDALTIVIRASDNEEGYSYEIYKGDFVETDEDSEDGGLCTTTMKAALGMAMSQAESIIKDEIGEECGGCWKSIDGTAFPSFFDEDTKLCVDCDAREKQEGDFIADR